MGFHVSWSENSSNRREVILHFGIIVNIILQIWRHIQEVRITAPVHSDTILNTNETSSSLTYS
jgi:hypothetical protein